MMIDRTLRAAPKVLLLTASLALSTLLAAGPAQSAASESETASREAMEAVESMAPVELDGVMLFRVRGTTSYPAELRAKKIQQRIEAVARDKAVRPDAVKTVEADMSTDIVAGDRILMSVVDADARLEGLDRPVVAIAHAGRVRAAIEQYRSDRSREHLTRGAVVSGIATLIFIVAVWLVVRTSRRAERFVESRYKARIHGLSIGSFEVVQAEHLWVALTNGLRTLRVLAVLVLLFVYLNSVLALFPWTRPTAMRLSAFVVDPFITLGRGAVSYLPNVLFLAVLFIVIRYVLKVARLFFNGVERGTVTISGFDADWAQPTYKIARLFVVGFGLVIAYPYIPGSESPAFKGLSLFLGVLVSLGSSSAISNIIAGYTLTYRRAFKVGDRVKIDDVIGYVMTVRLLVTHLHTIKNEEVIVPNSKILNSDIVNYSSLARTRGLILHTTVGIGYETPWRQVEAMLKIAADRTAGFLKDPEPFVWQLSLGDFCVTYELNAYCNDVRAMGALYTDMHRNILDVFNEHGVQIMTPAYEGDPDQPKVVSKEQWYAAPAARTEKVESPRAE